MNEDVSGLAHPVAAVSRLLLQSRIPVHVQHEDVVGPHEVEPHPPGLQRQQHGLQRRGREGEGLTGELVSATLTCRCMTKVTKWYHVYVCALLVRDVLMHII